MTNLADGDKIVVETTYTVANVVLERNTYIYTLHIPFPRLTNVPFSQPAPSPPLVPFNASVYEYDVFLPVGTSSTKMAFEKDPGVLRTDATYVGVASGVNTTICSNCPYGFVSGPSVDTWGLFLP